MSADGQSPVFPQADVDGGPGAEQRRQMGRRLVEDARADAGSAEPDLNLRLVCMVNDWLSCGESKLSPADVRSLALHLSIELERAEQARSRDLARMLRAKVRELREQERERFPTVVLSVEWLEAFADQLEAAGA